MRVRVWESQSSGSTLFILAVCKRVASVAHVRPPPSLPANRLFFLVIVWGLIARSTIWESISIRPSVRKRSSARLCPGLSPHGQLPPQRLRTSVKRMRNVFSLVLPALLFYTIPRQCPCAGECHEKAVAARWPMPLPQARCRGRSSNMMGFT